MSVNANGPGPSNGNGNASTPVRSWQADFLGHGDPENDYLGVSDDHQKSNNTPAVVPFNGTIRYVTVSNERSDVHQPVNVFVNGASVITVTKTMGTNTEVFTMTQPVNAGDRIAVHVGAKIGSGEKLKEPVIVVGVQEI